MVRLVIGRQASTSAPVFFFGFFFTPSMEANSMVNRPQRFFFSSGIHHQPTVRSFNLARPNCLAGRKILADLAFRPDRRLPKTDTPALPARTQFLWYRPVCKSPLPRN